MIARYFDHGIGKIRDRFIGLLELSNCDSSSICAEIDNFFKKLNIPFSNCIGFAADNAAVMMGGVNGVKAKFRHLNPHLYVIGCVCHSMHLCSSAASKAIPSEVECLVRDIYHFFAHSSKRQKEFCDFQEYFDIKKHKILNRSKTRWLSLEAAVQRILEQWVALEYFFRLSDFEDNSDIASRISKNLNSKNKCYLLFLSFALKTTNKINLEFQAVTPRFHTLLKTLKLFLKSVLNSFMLINSINFESLNDVKLDDESLHKPIHDIYLGPKVHLFLQNCSLDDNDIEEIKINCKKFYIILCKQILSRVNFKDPVLKAVEIINPTSLGPTLVPLMSAFPNIIENNEYEYELDNEWRQLILEEFEQNEDDLEVFWRRVFLLKDGLNEFKYLHLRQFIGSILSLPHSSATTERVFSQMKLIKSLTRNCLKVETVHNILLLKEIVSQEELSKWKPPDAIITKYTKVQK